MAILRKKQKDDIDDENKIDLEQDHNKDAPQEDKSNTKGLSEKATDGAKYGATHIFSPLPFDLVGHAGRTGKASGRIVAKGVEGIIINPAKGIFIDPTKRLYRACKGEGLDEIPGNYTTRPPFEDYYEGLISKAQLKKDGLHYINRFNRWIAGVIFIPQLAFVSWVAADDFSFAVLTYFMFFTLMCLARATQFWSAYMSIYTNYNGSPIEYLRHFIKKKSYREMIPDEKRLNSALSLYAKVKKDLQEEQKDTDNKNYG